MPLDLLGVCPLNRGRMGVSCYHVHEVARPGLSAATNVHTYVCAYRRGQPWGGARLTFVCSVVAYVPSRASAFAAEVRSERRLGQAQIQGRHGGGSAGPTTVTWCISLCTFSVCGT